MQLWHFALGTFEYTIHYRPGLNNYAADLFSRICSLLTSASTNKNLYYIHKILGHPGITRLRHFIRSKNLSNSLSDVKKTCQNCNTCAEMKPRFCRKPTETLISATQPWQRISLDFKAPVKRKKKSFDCN